MEKKTWITQCRRQLKQMSISRWLIIFLTGILLVILSFPNHSSKQKKWNANTTMEQKVQQQEINAASTTEQEEIDKLEKKLAHILKKVAGIGAVDVMITQKSSKEQVPLKDCPYTQESTNETDHSGGTRLHQQLNRQESSIMVQKEDGTTTPYIVKELEPEIEGVLVIAQGGDQEIIRQQIIEAIEVLFGLPSHKIKVMKMDEK